MKKLFLSLILSSIFFFTAWDTWNALSVIPVCPIYDVTPPKPGCEYVFETDQNWCNVPTDLVCNNTPKICTKEYTPVCGKIKDPACNAPGCWESTTYSFVTYSNKCTLEAAWATFVNIGLCKGSSPITTPKVILPKNITERADKILDKYSERLTKWNISNSRKLIIANKLIVRLELRRSPDNNKNKELLINYLIEELQEMKKEYE